MKKSSLEEVYEKYKDNVFAIAFNYFKNSVDADDVVSEVFYKYLISKKEFESEAHIKNWLIRVSVNECKRVTLSSWFKTKVSLEDYSESLAFTEPEQGELFMEVMSLPKKYRQVIHLYYFEDYKTKEIAEILGISESAVSTRLQRGRTQLKTILSEA